MGLQGWKFQILSILTNIMQSNEIMFISIPMLTAEFQKIKGAPYSP